MQSPKISAVMALYNTPFEFLTPTIESILNQTFKDFELIIIDDASTIEYSKFFDELNDERIKYFKLDKNAGPGHARNVGIKKAIGEYVAIVDSDDIYFPKRFELQAKFLDKNPDVSLMGCAYRFSNRKHASYVPISYEEIKTFMLFNSPLNNSTIMFRKDVMVQKNLFYIEDINFGEDYELWINAMFANVKMANLQDLLMIYTRRSGQLSKAKLDKQTKILKGLYKEMFNKIGFNPSDEEIYLHWLLNLQKYNKIKSENLISDWFDKIIEFNKSKQIFDEQSLINKKNEFISKFIKVKNRLFKIKIGEYNYCLSKKLNFYIEARD